MGHRCRCLLAPLANCLNCFVSCATFMHDSYTSWRWSSDAELTDLELASTTICHSGRSRSIHAAVSDKNLAEIRRILEEEPEARASVNSSQETALHLACRLGYVRAVDCLLENGCLPVILTDLGTPMHCTLHALKSGYISEEEAITQIYLLAHRGCDIDAIDRGQKTTLFLAVEQCFRRCVESILHLGAQLNCPDNNQFTPLYMSAIKGDLVIARMLLSKVPLVDVDFRDSAGRTPLFAALIMVMNNLRYERLPNDIYNMGFASREELEDYRQNQLAIIELLLKAGADPNAMDRHGRTPLTISFIILELDNIRGTVFGGYPGSFESWARVHAPSSEALETCGQEESVYAILIRLLLLFGAHAPDGWHKDISKFPEWMKDLYEDCVVARSRQSSHEKVPKLQHMCRMLIRAHLATVHHLLHVTYLPIPTRLKDYIEIRYS